MACSFYNYGVFLAFVLFGSYLTSGEQKHDYCGNYTQSAHNGIGNGKPVEILTAQGNDGDDQANCIGDAQVDLLNKQNCKSKTCAVIFVIGVVHVAFGIKCAHKN